MIFEPIDFHTFFLQVPYLWKLRPPPRAVDMLEDMYKIEREKECQKILDFFARLRVTGDIGPYRNISIDTNARRSEMEP